MKQRIQPLAQRYANFLIQRLKISKSEQEFGFWYSLAVYLDQWCVYKHDIYLD